MKKKAIRTAGSYDEFKNLVACAQQKPVDRGSLLTFTDAKGIRNRVAGTAASSRAGDAATVLAAAASSAAGVDLPKNVHEFTRDWSRKCPTPAAKFVFIAKCPAKRLLRIFSGELDSAILSDIVGCFDAVLTAGGDVEGWEKSADEVPAKVIAILEVFPSVERFDLTVDLLTKDDFIVLRRVLDAVQTRTADDAVISKISALRRQYKCE